MKIFPLEQKLINIYEKYTQNLRNMFLLQISIYFLYNSIQNLKQKNVKKFFFYYSNLDNFQITI